MKKISLFYIAAVTLIFIVMVSACKKTQHAPNPTPANYRIMSYDKITNYTKDDKYTFTFDANGRVSLIAFSSNDASDTVQFQNIAFTYAGDSIYKTIYNVVNNKVIERDTFIVNTANQITTVYNPFSVFNFSYYGNLLAKEFDTYRDSGTLISLTKTYTSDNADIYQRFFDGTLNATFADTGFKSLAYINDTDFSTPFSAIWVAGTNVLLTPSMTIEHDGVSSLKDAITGYSGGGPVVLTGLDGNGVHTRAAATVPGDLWATESFFVWPELANRTGDYMGLASLTTYGINIYPNAHLVKFITNPGNNTYITYDIDADSKITQATAVIRDSLTHQATTVVYRMQYITF
jgi:hypothetical protein